MLKRLRLKFILINMTIVTILLSAILALIYSFTSAGIEQESLNMMKNLAVHPPGIVTPDTPGDDVRIPYFVIQMGIDGEFVAAEGGYFDLSDRAFLDRLVDDTLKSPKTFGVLHKYKLRYYRLDTPMIHRLVFADISNEQATLRHLFRICCMVGILGFLIFLSVSVLLSSWAVRPVETAWTLQKQFVADASHELKTPLAVIMTDIELVRSKEFDEKTEHQLLSGIETVTRQMKKLLEEMLFLARSDAGERKREVLAVNVSRLAEETVLSFEPVFFEKNRYLEASIQPDLEILGDGDKLQRLFGILLDNAAKYSYEKGTTRLFVGETKEGVKKSRIFLMGRKKKKVRITVENPGEPISEEELLRLFKRFYRADASRSRDGSFGLGLAIAESIVREHKGIIWAESHEGVNSFHVEL